MLIIVSYNKVYFLFVLSINRISISMDSNSDGMNAILRVVWM